MSEKIDMTCFSMYDMHVKERKLKVSLCGGNYYELDKLCDSLFSFSMVISNSRTFEVFIGDEDFKPGILNKIIDHFSKYNIQHIVPILGEEFSVSNFILEKALLRKKKPKEFDTCDYFAVVMNNRASPDVRAEYRKMKLPTFSTRDITIYALTDDTALMNAAMLDDPRAKVTKKKTLTIEMIDSAVRKDVAERINLIPRTK